MILDRKDDLPAFRAAIREWLASVVPDDWQTRLAGCTHDEMYEFQLWWMGERSKVGLATPHWPVAYGGAGLSLKHQIVMSEEFARANAPSSQMFIVSLTHVPATLIQWGTDAQKARYLPGVGDGDLWCQGFSEPGAGSDLASLRTRAVLAGDRYVVNGQKIWSSYAMHAKYCILLTRTDPEAPKHKGITYFILDMQAPGVEVRPIRQASGHADFAELFLTDVEIKVEDRVGPENEGWKVAMTTLSSERGIIAFEGFERFRFAVEHFLEDAVRAKAEWLEDDALRREFIMLFADLQACRRLIRQVLRDNEEEGAAPSNLPNIVKLFGTTWRQRFADFLVRIRGLDGQRLVVGTDETNPLGMFNYLSTFGDTISGGTNEIMRNIIAERMLGLPR